MQNEKFEIVAKTFQGLEGVLAEEITAIGGKDVKQDAAWYLLQATKLYYTKPT